MTITLEQLESIFKLDWERVVGSPYLYEARLLDYEGSVLYPIIVQVSFADARVKVDIFNGEDDAYGFDISTEFSQLIYADVDDIEPELRNYLARQFAPMFWLTDIG
jgi:hypothetical protein